MKIRDSFSLIIFLSSTLYAKPPQVGPPAPLEFNPTQAERTVLSNGIVVFLMEDHELPLLDVTLKMKASPADEPENLRGSMSLMGSVWRTGGTRERKPETLNEALEQMATHIETSAGEESASISMSCLSKNAASSWLIFKDILLNPQFSENQLALAKGKILESIRRKNDDPWNIGRRAFRDVTYGQDHYYAWNPTSESVQKIKQKDLAALHKKVVAPDQATLVVVGDFDRKIILKDLEVLMGSWTKASRHVSSYDYTVDAASTGTVFFVQKELTQSLIYIGGLGLSRHNPDQYALTVGNYILGDGGASRLFAQIRSRLGLAYAVGSFFTSPKGPGLAGAACQTKAESTLTAIKAMKKELMTLSNQPPTSDEMALAKDALLNSFVFRFESPSQIAYEQADLEFFGFPSDYLTTYPAKIRALSAAEVASAAKKYFDPVSMKIVVIGDKEKLGQPLNGLGIVTEIPLARID